MSIGEVLRRLRDEFPDVTISKIRFLETEGLVEPQRSASGYRKFSFADVEQLRYVLAAQRDHYLPLKVIKEHLDAIARGLEPPAIAGESPRAPRAEPDAAAYGSLVRSDDIALSRSELLANSGLTEALLGELEQYGLVRLAGDGDHYDRAALTIAAAAAALSRHGLEPRHLRTFKTAAEREAALIDQVVTLVARRRDSDAAVRAAAVRQEVAAHATRLHDALVRQSLSGPV